MAKQNSDVSKGPDGIETTWEAIDPVTAERYLEKNLPHNRNFMDTVSARYEQDMKDGNWVATHEGIAFDLEDFLVDGQHRLKAIGKTGTQMVLVTRGLSKRAVEVINRGKIRNLAHALQVCGFEHANGRLVATARIMKSGPISYGMKTLTTDQQLKSFISKHIDAIVFGLSACGTSQGPAIFSGLLARAYYHADSSDLRRFIFAMNDKIPSEDSKPGDKSARALAALWANGRYGGSTLRGIIYRKAQNALQAYLNNQAIIKLHESNEDLFPIPENVDAKAPKEKTSA